MRHLVIGIEGYVGAGKTAICRTLLNKIPNSIILQGGNFYRAIVFALMSSGIDLNQLKPNMQQVDIKQFMKKLKVQIVLENRETVIYIDEKKIDEEDLQSVSVSLAVSEISNVADNKNIYLFGRQLIEQFKSEYNLIVSGRDLMKIYPEMDYHFFITASLDERVKRKCIQYNWKVSEEKIRENIIKRDKLQETSGYYKQYEKTILVDVTDCKTVEEGANKVCSFLKNNVKN